MNENAEPMTPPVTIKETGWYEFEFSVPLVRIERPAESCEMFPLDVGMTVTQLDT